MRSLVPRYLVGLEVSHLTDAQLHDVVASVKKAAPTSSLVQADPAMQACVTALDQKDQAFTKSAATATDAKTTLKLATTDEGEKRADLQGQVRTYVTLTTNSAKSPADVHNAGLPPAPPRPAKNTPPDVPEQIDVRIPKRGHGRAIAAVHETGTTRHQYVAQQSTDGTTWSPLGVSHGKTRSVTGATGTKIWVRFAMVRGQIQSDWSTPVLVTIP